MRRSKGRVGHALVRPPQREAGVSSRLFRSERRSPQSAMKLGIRLCLAVISYLYTILIFESLDVDRRSLPTGRRRFDADRQPADGANPKRVAIDKTVIQLYSDRDWLYAAVDRDTNSPHIRPVRRKTRGLPRCFALNRASNSTSTTLSLVDGAPWLRGSWHRHGLRFQRVTRDHRSTVRPISFRVKRQTNYLSNMFSHVKPSTAENRFQAFAVE